MHACLRISDIVLMICDKVAENICYHVERDSQLFALALTCREFQHPALAKLWETIHHIDPIIKCAGRDLWKNDEVNLWDKELQLSRDISDSDIKIMRKYAPLVRYIGRCSQRHKNAMYLSPHLWETLGRAFQGTPLFFALRSLVCYDPQLMDSPAFINAQNLTSFAMPFGQVSKTLTDFSARCPGLTSLELSTDKRYTTRHLHTKVLQSISTSLSNWHRLSRLVLGYATLGVLEALSGNSNNLRYLQIGHFLYQTPNSNKTGSLIFPSLDTLEIGFSHDYHAVEFMNILVATSHFRSLLLNFSLRLNYFMSMHILDSLLKYSHSLKKLAIRQLISLDIDPEDILAHAEPFTDEELFGIADGFRALTHIELYVWAGYDISNEDIKKLTKEMPLIEEYCLYTDIDGTYAKRAPTITIACLPFFAKNCKYLSHLALTLDADDSFVEEVELEEPGLNVEWLDVDNSEECNPKLVAPILTNIFPNLQYLDTESDPGSWSEVRDILGIKAKGGGGTGIL